jgi:hypothetical protein
VSAKALAADRLGLPVTIDQEIGRCTPDGPYLAWEEANFALQRRAARHTFRSGS